MKKTFNTLTLILAFCLLGSLGYIAYLLSSGSGNSMNCTDCTKKNFCGVPTDMLIRFIRNYKSEVWQKTSNEATQQYDARFLEIDVNQLENFICYAKKTAAADHLNVASIRVYYINYDGTKKTEPDLLARATGNVLEDYSGCHSLAFVPVVGRDMTDPARRDYYMEGLDVTKSPGATDFEKGQADGKDGDGLKNLVFIPGLNQNCSRTSPVANHNELCPPFVGCIENTLLAIADGL
jgi:hypothetical protein